jgi:hypothetical protein
LRLLAGTVKLGTNIVIDVLAQDYSYDIDSDARLWLDGADVTLPNGTTNNWLAIYGKLQVTGNSTFTEQTNFGTILREQGAFIVESGTIEINNFRTSTWGISGDHVGSYIQSGGTVTITNEGSNSDYAAFHLPYPSNVFQMSGGTLTIEDQGNGGAGDEFALIMNCSLGNYNVTGGSVIIDMKYDVPYLINSTVPFWDFIIRNSVDADQTLTISEFVENPGDEPDDSNDDLVDMTAQPLVVLNDLTIETNCTLDANGIDVKIGDDFTLEDGGTYVHGNNTTHFIENKHSTIKVENTVNPGELQFYNVTINKDQRYDISLFWKVEVNSPGRGSSDHPVEIMGDLYIERGEFDVDEWEVDLKGNIEIVDGQIISSENSKPKGWIVLNGSTQQTLKGALSAEQEFGSLELYNRKGAKLLSDINVSSIILTPEPDTSVFDLDVYNLHVADSIYTPGTYSEKIMIKTAGNASDGGLTFEVDLSTGVAGTETLFPIGTGSVYNPAKVIQNGTINDTGMFTINPVNTTHPSATDPSKTIPYYWIVDTAGFSSLAYDEIKYTFTYNGGAMPGSINKGLNLWPTDYEWYSHNNVVNGNDIEFPYDVYLTEDFTIGNKSEFNQPIIYYSRVVSQDYNINSMPQWSDGDTWSTDSHTGAAASDFPKDGDIAIIGYGGSGGGTGGNRHHVAYRATDNYSLAKVIVDESEESGVWDSRLFIEEGATIDMGVVDGDGTIEFRLDPASPITVTGDFGDFINNYDEGSRVMYHFEAGTTEELPSFFSTYPNLRIEGGGNRTAYFPEEVVVLSDLVVDYELTLRVEHDLTVHDDMRLGSHREGILEFTDDAACTVTIYDELSVRKDNDSRVIVDNSTPNNLEHRLIIGGDIELDRGNRFDLFSDNTGGNNVILEIFGENDSELSNTDNMPVELYRLEINKLTGKKFTIARDPGNSGVSMSNFSLNGPTNGDTKALEINSGDLYLHDAGIDITLSSGGADFEIPSDSKLSAQWSTLRVSGTNTGIRLDGAMSVGYDSKWYINEGTNNYIEYGASGSAEIKVLQGELQVGSQVRRATNTDEGILTFNQAHSNSTIIIGTNADQGGEGSRGIFEICNSGSSFTQVANANITIGNSIENASLASLYLDIDASAMNLASSSKITFGNSNTATSREFDIYASRPLKNIEVDNTSGNNPTLLLNTVPLTMDTLTVATGAVFNANGLDLTLNGDMVMNGTFSASGNNTYFSGTNDQSITGTPQFYNLYKTTSNTLALNDDIDVDNELHLQSGIFNDGDNSLTVQGNVWMDGTHAWGGTSEGIKLNGSATQTLTGNGTFGKLAINNSNGVSLPIGSEFVITDELQLESGILDIGKNLLVLNENAVINEKKAFSTNNMIQTNISFTDAGVKKYFPAIASSTGFTFPMGSEGKFTPVELNISAMDAGGSIRVKAANEMHPTITNDAEPCNEITDTINALDYHWLMYADGVSGFTSSASMKYYDEDYLENSAFYDVDDYIAARLLSASTSWNKYDEASFDEANNLLKFDFTNASDDEISGDYTAGVEDQGGTCEGAIPNDVPIYISISDGDWTDKTIWDTYPVSGGAVPNNGPRGAIAIVEHQVTIPQNYILNYKTTINNTGTLIVGNTYGHRLGIVEGRGTLKLDRGDLPAGIYDDFFGVNGGTVEFSGNSDYDILGGVTNVKNLKFTGTGERRFANIDLDIYGQLTIAGDDATLEVINEYDKTFTIDSNIVFSQGSFDAGTGSSAKVVLEGANSQTITGDFTGTNAFYNLEINNSAGITMAGSIEIDNNLELTSGVVTSSAANLITVDNASTTAVTGYGSSNYIDGPLRKLINSGDDFTFPVGDGGRYGKIVLGGASSSTTGYWEAEYYNENPHPTYDTSQFASPLFMVSGNEYWRVEGPEPTSSGNVTIRWDDASELPAMTSDRSSNLHVARWVSASSRWESAGDDVTDLGVNEGTVKTTSAVTMEEQFYTLASSETAPLATAKFTNDDTTLCNGQSVELEILLSGDPNWIVTIEEGGDSYTFPAQATSPLSFTVDSAGTYSITAVSDDNGPGTVFGYDVTVTVIALPSAFNVTGGGSFCEGTGGVAVGLDGSEAGVNYELFADATSAGIFAGDGNPLDFGNQTTDAAYTVEATESTGTCTVTMTGNAIVTENASPDVTLTVDEGLDTICDGTNTEISITFTAGLAPYDFTVSDGTNTDSFTGINTSPYTYTPSTPPVWVDDGSVETHYYYSITTITDANGCSNTNLGNGKVTIFKQPETGPNYHIPNDW